MKKVEDYVRSIPDFPEKGVIFRDITTVIQDPEGFRLAINEMKDLLKGLDFDMIAGAESRGFIFGAPLAYAMGKGFVLIRKKGKLPAATIGEDYDMEYGTSTIEVHTDAISPGNRILLIDDLIATGGTAEAAVKLIRKCGGEVVECAFLVNLPELGGNERLREIGCPTFSLCAFDGE